MPTKSKRGQGSLEKEVMVLLRERLQHMGWPAELLAGTADMSASQLSRIFSGQRPASFTEVDDLCTAVGLDVADVVAAARGRVGA